MSLGSWGLWGVYSEIRERFSVCIWKQRGCVGLCSGIVEYMYFETVVLCVGIFWVVHETTVYLVFFESLCIYRLFVVNIWVVCWLHMLVFEHIQGEWFCVKIR